MHNDGPTSIRVRSVDANPTGAQLIAADTNITIAARHSRWVRTVFHISDCRHPNGDSYPLHLRISRWYGTQTLTVQDHGTDYDNAFTACGIGPMDDHNTHPTAPPPGWPTPTHSPS